MKIGFDAKRAFFNTTGLGNYSRTLLSNLSKLYPDNEYVLYTPKAEIQLNKVQFQIADNMLVQSPQTFWQKLFGGSLWRSLFLGNQIQKDKLDIYHGLSNELPNNIAKGGAKNVVTIHDLIFLRYPELYPSIDRKTYLQKSKKACAAADKVIAISEQTKQDIVEFLGTPANKIEVVYQGCNPIFYDYDDAVFLQHGFFMEKEYKLPDGMPTDYILYVGSINERKNLLNLIKAVQALQPKLDVHLVVVGRDDGREYVKQVKNYVAQNGLNSQVSFFHNLSQKQLPAVYRCAKCLVYPSTFEGFGLPIIEGLFSRIPVITSKGSCFSEAGGHHTLYITPQNIEELADAIEKCLTEGALRMDMIMHGWEHVQQFKEEKVTARMMALYQSLL